GFKQWLAGPRIPKTRCSIVGSGDDLRTFRIELGRADLVRMFEWSSQPPTAGDIPDLGGAVYRRRNDPLVIGAEARGADGRAILERRNDWQSVVSLHQSGQ